MKREGVRQKTCSNGGSMLRAMGLVKDNCLLDCGYHVSALVSRICPGSMPPLTSPAFMLPP